MSSGMKREPHFGSGILVAPLVAPILLYVIFWVLEIIFSPSGRHAHGMSGLLGFLPFGIAVSYASTVLLGTPLYLGLRKLNLLTKTLFISGSAVLGVVPFLIYALILGTVLGPPKLPEYIVMFLLGGSLGSTVAGIFWYLSGLAVTDIDAENQRRIRRWLRAHVFTRFGISIMIVSLVLIVFQVNLRNLIGSGVILDFATKKPIVGAALVLDCRDSADYYESKIIRKIKTTSLEDGKYSFKFTDTWNCTSVGIDASKNGYKKLSDIGYPGMRFSPVTPSIPSQIWMVNEKDITRLLLERELALSKEPTYPAVAGSQALYDYRHLAAGFVYTTTHASTEQDRQFIRDNYCERLMTLYASIPEKEKKKSLLCAKNGDQTVDVIAFCQSSSEIKNYSCTINDNILLKEIEIKNLGMVKPGKKVNHPLFGDGVIEEIYQTESGTKIVRVKFDKYGSKTLTPEYPNLTSRQ